jgi:sulfhydrogenase subunit alpha
MNDIRKVDILTRVEGHGSVELILDRARVVDARFNLYESPRLFEALLVGRRFDEIADIACRICSICSTVHKVAALQAVEQAMGIVVSRQTALLRELAVQGGQIESHALHLFCLALPDYLGVNGFHELAAIAPERLKFGLKIKKLGNMIQEIVGGRAIHPFNLLLGGLGKIPNAGELTSVGEQLEEIRGEVSGSVAYILGLKELLPPIGLFPTCAVSGGAPLFGDHLVTNTSLTIPAQSAASWLDEQVQSHSNAKVSNFSGTDTYMVGPLARLSLSMPVEYGHHFITATIGSSVKARIVELQLAVERAKVLVEELLSTSIYKEPALTIKPTEGTGTALIEAPRGVLLHSYRFDSEGVCCNANIITPTAINQGAIAGSLKELVLALDGAEYSQVKSAAEILIRCYDPCISCAVH